MLQSLPTAYNPAHHPVLPFLLRLPFTLPTYSVSLQL